MKGYNGLGSLKNRTALATFFGKTKNTKKERKDIYRVTQQAADLG